MRKYSFYFWTVVVSILLLSTLNNASGLYDNYNNKTNFTENEAFVIAQSHPEINEWLIETNGMITIVEVDFGYWYLIFKSQTNSSYLHAIVDDESGEVVSINYLNSDDRWYFYQDMTLWNQAREYFLTLPESSAFVDLNFDIELGYSGVANYIDLYGRSWDGNNDLNMDGLIKFNMTQSGYTFSLAFISANIQFGETSNTFTDAKDQAIIQPSVMDFYGNYTVNNVNVRQWLIKEDFRRWDQENKMRQLDPGYYFELRYESWEYFNDVVTSTITVPVLHQATSDIVIDYDGSYWHEIILSDLTGETVREFGTFIKNHSYDEIAEIVLSDPEIIDWFVDVNEPYMYVSYNGYGIFYVDIWSNNWYESANIIISDETGDVLYKDIRRAIYPTKSFQDVLSIALSVPDISNWILSIEDYRVNYYYDFSGQWYINFFDPIISDSWADVSINDSNGFIFWVDAYIGQTPNMAQDEVINVALSTDLSDFYNTHPDAKISMFYNYDDEWWVYVYSPVILEEYILIVIDDDNGRIRDDIEYHRTSTMPDSSYNDVEAAMLADGTYKEFVSMYSVQYQTIYYYNNYWYVYVEGLSSDGYLGYLDMEITDTARVQNAGFYESGEFNSWHPRGEEMQWHFQDQRSTRYIGKQLSTPLGEVIEGYVILTTRSTTSSRNENTSPNLDLDGFSLLPSMIAIFVMIPIYLKRKNNNT